MSGYNNRCLIREEEAQTFHLCRRSGGCEGFIGNRDNDS